MADNIRFDSLLQNRLNDLGRDAVGLLSAVAIAQKVKLASVITPEALPISWREPCGA
jgi:hypothetical protein